MATAFNNCKWGQTVFPSGNPKLQFSEIVIRPAGTWMAWAPISHELLNLLSWPLFYIPNDVQGLLFPDITLPGNKQLSGFTLVPGTGLTSGETVMNMIHFLSSKIFPFTRGNRLINLKVTFYVLKLFSHFLNNRAFAVFQATPLYCWTVLTHSTNHYWPPSVSGTVPALGIQARFLSSCGLESGGREKE